ncbi:hypothetical protein I4U23_005894 [Adineta vaga]|nr:hypothetical protein I4U23_005894 [Adineta vaga]
MAFNTEYAATLHRHVIMWVDEFIGEPGNNEHMKDRFRRITYPIYTFTETRSAKQFIEQEQTANKTVFLIISGRLALELVPEVYDYLCLKQIFLFTSKICDYRNWAIDYIEKILMFDFDEDLLIRLTNEIATHLTDEAKIYENQDRIEQAAGLLDWALWLYNDAETLKQEACRKFLTDIHKKRQKLAIDHLIVYPNRFNT